MRKNIIKAVAGITAAIFIIASAAGCSAESKTTERLYTEAIKKTVELRVFNDGKTGYAAGGVISADGKILTNRHVVSSDGIIYEKIEARFYNETDFSPVTVETVSDTCDLAIVRLERNTPDYFNISDGVSGGEAVYAIGNPNGFGLSFSEGRVSSPLRIVEYDSSSVKTIQTSLVISEGNSGGPLFNSNGALLGVISFRMRDEAGDIVDGVSFAIHFSEVNDLLARGTR